MDADTEEKKVKACNTFGLTSPLGFYSSSSSSSPIPVSRQSFTAEECRSRPSTMGGTPYGVGEAVTNPAEADVLFRNNQVLKDNVATLKAVVSHLMIELEQAQAMLKTHNGITLVNQLFTENKDTAVHKEVAVLQKRVEALEKVVDQKDKTIQLLQSELESRDKEYEQTVKPLLEERNRCIQQLTIALDEEVATRQFL